MTPSEQKLFTWLMAVLDEAHADDFSKFFNGQQRAVLQAELDRLTKPAEQPKES